MNCSCGRTKCTCQKNNTEGCLCFSCCATANEKCGLCGRKIPAIYFSNENSTGEKKQDTCQCFLFVGQEANNSLDAQASTDRENVVLTSSVTPKSNTNGLNFSLSENRGKCRSLIKTKEESEVAIASEYGDKITKTSSPIKTSRYGQKIVKSFNKENSKNIVQEETNALTVKEKHEENNNLNFKKEEIRGRLGESKKDQNDKPNYFVFPTPTSNYHQQNFENFTDFVRVLGSNNHFSRGSPFNSNQRNNRTFCQGDFTHRHSYRNEIPVINPSTRTSPHIPQQNRMMHPFTRSQRVPSLHGTSFQSHQQNTLHRGPGTFTGTSFQSPHRNYLQHGSNGIRVTSFHSHQPNRLRQVVPFCATNANFRSVTFPYPSHHYCLNSPPAPTFMPPTVQYLPSTVPYRGRTSRLPYVCRNRPTLTQHYRAHVIQKVKMWLIEQDFDSGEYQPPTSTSYENRILFAELPFANESSSSNEGSSDDTTNSSNSIFRNETIGSSNDSVFL